MDPFSAGVQRTLRGLRTGDRTALIGGLALLGFSVWRNRRKRPPQLISKTTVKPGETLVIRGTRMGDVGRDPSSRPPAEAI